MDRETLLRLLQNQMQSSTQEDPALNEENPEFNDLPEETFEDQSDSEIIDNPSSDIEAKKLAIQKIKEKYLGR